MKKFLSLALILAICLCPPALAYAETSAGQEFSYIGKSVSGKSAIEFLNLDAIMYIGKIYKLEAQTTLADELTISIKTSDKTVLGLKRDSQGIMYAVPKSTGKAILTARVAYNGKVYADRRVVRVKKVSITGVTTTPSVSLVIGETYKLETSITPKIMTGATVKWTSSDANVAKVSSDGTVTAVGEGRAVIKAKAGTKSAACVVTVSLAAHKEYALIFGMGADDSGYEDYGFEALTTIREEITSISEMFTSMGISPRMYYNRTKNQLMSYLGSFANTPGYNDVTYVYYSGHGVVYDGELVLIAGTDKEITAEELKSKLDAIPGKIVLFLNCCESGDVIGKSATISAYAKAFAGKFAGSSSKSSEFIDSKYTVICACKSDQSGWIVPIDNRDVDVYAESFTLGLGWSLSGHGDNGLGWQSDANSDGQVTVSELALFMRASIKALIKNYSNIKQTLVYYAANTNEVLFRK